MSEVAAGTDGVLEQTLRIKARPETVWRYWTDPERLCDWWGSAAELAPEPGGTCRVEMGPSDAPVMSGRYLELEPHHRLVFSFGWERTATDSEHAMDDVPPGSTRVEVTLVADGQDTILTLRHLGLPPRHTDAHGGGWAHFLGNLAQHLATIAAPTEPGATP
ncbi:MAG: SRPBCC family protein [Acidimicrobiales bacterium]